MEFDYDSGEICNEIESPLSHKGQQTPGLSHAIKKLDMFYFLEETKRWQKYENTYSSVKGQTKLSFLTWNLWFGSFFFEQRTNEVARIIEELSPDVVSLQQVTPSMIRLLEKVPYIRQNYYLSDVDGSTVTPIGALLLAKFPFLNLTLRPLVSNSGRELLLANIRVNKTDICIACACLEARQRSTELRQNQAQSMNRKVSAEENVILLLNANNWGETEKNEIIQCFPQLRDAWSQVHPDLKGYTIDTTTNAMINNQIVAKQGRTQNRHDRTAFVLFKSTHWSPTSSKLVGNQPISSIFPKKVDGQTLESRMQNLLKDSNTIKEEESAAATVTGEENRLNDAINMTPPRSVTFYSTTGQQFSPNKPNTLSYSLDSIYSPKKLKQNLGSIYPSNHFGIYIEFVIGTTTTSSSTSTINT